MASSTGIPENVPGIDQEDEPLLGRRGDASQREGKPLPYNFYLGTGVIAQAGIWVLVAVIWGAIFSHELIFFSAHPLLNSAGILLITQGVLVLQPTHTAEQKRQGTYVHATLNDLGVACLLAGLIVIEINKGDHARFQSPHAILGLVTYILMFIQALVGLTMYFVPRIYGGLDNAKAIWKYHRMSGYVVFTLSLATICAATQTFYIENFIGIQLWAVIVCSVLVLLGMIPRVKKQKLGL